MMSDGNKLIIRGSPEARRPTRRSRGTDFGRKKGGRERERERRVVVVVVGFQVAQGYWRFGYGVPPGASGSNEGRQLWRAVSSWRAASLPAAALRPPRSQVWRRPPL